MARNNGLRPPPLSSVAEGQHGEARIFGGRERAQGGVKANRLNLHTCGRPSFQKMLGYREVRRSTFAGMEPLKNRTPPDRLT